MHKSIATIDSPEFINLKKLDINPLMSSCEIKVLYLGENRNHSSISKDVAIEMSKTLRGAPIVGYYKDKKEDFVDHGEKVVWDDEGISFECMTVPYGFVSPDAKVWFQKFNDYDELGNVIQREYLMTTGYLWTGQFKECRLAVEDEGRPQSMELDESTISGEWSVNCNTGVEFFIINDATFSKLCILGEDVEPCFEGSSVTAPNISTSFTKVDNEFKQTLYTMMQDLRFALQGGTDMAKENIVETAEIVENNVEETAAAVEYTEVETEIEVQETESVEEVIEEEVETSEEIETEIEEEAEVESDFAKKEEKEEDKTDKEESDNSDNETEDEEEDDKKKKELASNECKKKHTLEEEYSLLEEQHKELESKYAALEADYKELVEFKLIVDNQKKDELISSFYMLDEKDIKDIVANKEKYTYEEIESKLSILYAKGRYSEAKTEEKTDVTTYNVDTSSRSLPDWIKAVQEVEKTNS